MDQRRRALGDLPDVASQEVRHLGLYAVFQSQMLNSLAISLINFFNYVIMQYSLYRPTQI